MRRNTPARLAFAAAIGFSFSSARRRPARHRRRHARRDRQKRSGVEEDSRPGRHRPLEPHREYRSLGRRPVDDLRLSAERRRRHALRSPARWRQELHDSHRLGAGVLRRFALHRLFRQPAERGRGTRWSGRRWWTRPGGAGCRPGVGSTTFRGARPDDGRQVQRARWRDVQVL